MSDQSPDRRCGGMFRDETVDVTGGAYMNATFVGCTVVRHKTQSEDDWSRFFNCYFQGCTFAGDGWPEGWGVTHAMPNGLEPSPST